MTSRAPIAGIRTPKQEGAGETHRRASRGEEKGTPTPGTEPPSRVVRATSFNRDAPRSTNRRLRRARQCAAGRPPMTGTAPERRDAAWKNAATKPRRSQVEPEPADVALAAARRRGQRGRTDPRSKLFTSSTHRSPQTRTGQRATLPYPIPRGRRQPSPAGGRPADASRTAARRDSNLHRAAPNRKAE